MTVVHDRDRICNPLVLLSVRFGQFEKVVGYVGAYFIYCLGWASSVVRPFRILAPFRKDPMRGGGEGAFCAHGYFRTTVRTFKNHRTTVIFKTHSALKNFEM